MQLAVLFPSSNVITGSAVTMLLDLAVVLLNIWEVKNTTLGPKTGDDD